jgi:tRNA-dihydrouridine synthase B
MIKQLKLGNLTLKNNLMLAPMAGLTNLALRLLAREFGAALCFTEMVSVHGLVRDGKKTFELLESTHEDRPLGIQLFGDDPELLAEGARRVEGLGDLIDINMGCPVRKVVNGGAGSALMRDPVKVRMILRAVRPATTLPLTIKIRTGWNAQEHTFLEIARIAEEQGCDAVTLHPRNRAQMFGNSADWSRIAELKSSLKIPVIGSGDLFAARDAVRMLDQTCCDGVMIARGALGNPWIFAQALALLSGKNPESPSPKERLRVALRQLELFTALAGEQTALREMRKHLAWYSKGLPGAAQLRDAINRIEEKDALLNTLNSFFQQETDEQR